VVVLNQELRFAGPGNIGAAVFYDAGNVFDRIKDFSLSLRHSVGFGLRYGSAIGLVRLDLAFPLSRRPNDRGYQLWFGLGQAF
jgi:translocation and assembly module TamA